MNELTARPIGPVAVDAGDDGDARGEVAEHLAKPRLVDGCCRARSRRWRLLAGAGLPTDPPRATGDADSPQRAVRVTGSPGATAGGGRPRGWTAKPSAMRPAATRWARCGSSGQPAAAGRAAAATGARRRASTRRPRPWRSEPANVDWWAAGAGRTLGRVGRRPPPAAHAHHGRNGQSPQPGPLAAHGGAHVEEGLVPLPPPAWGREGVGQRLGLPRPQAMSGEGSGQHPGRVHVHHAHVRPVGEGQHGPGRVGTHAGEAAGRQVVGRRPAWCSSRAAAVPWTLPPGGCSPGRPSRARRRPRAPPRKPRSWGSGPGTGGTGARPGPPGSAGASPRSPRRPRGHASSATGGRAGGDHANRGAHICDRRAPRHRPERNVGRRCSSSACATTSTADPS